MKYLQYVDSKFLNLLQPLNDMEYQKEEDSILRIVNPWTIS